MTAILTAVAVCGMFVSRAEGTTDVRQTQFSAAKAPADLAVLLPEESGTVACPDVWLKPTTLEPAWASTLTGLPQTRIGTPPCLVAVSSPALSRRLVGTIELRL